MLGELSTLTRDLLLRKTAPEGGAALLSGGFDSATLDKLGSGVPANRFLFLASTLQKAAGDLYYSADRRTDAELCLLRLCDESLCGDLTALENRITRLENAVDRGVEIRSAVTRSVSAARDAAVLFRERGGAAFPCEKGSASSPVCAGGTIAPRGTSRRCQRGTAHAGRTRRAGL